MLHIEQLAENKIRQYDASIWRASYRHIWKDATQQWYDVDNGSGENTDRSLDSDGNTSQNSNEEGTLCYFLHFCSSDMC